MNSDRLRELRFVLTGSEKYATDEDPTNEEKCAMMNNEGYNIFSELLDELTLIGYRDFLRVTR